MFNVSIKEKFNGREREFFSGEFPYLFNINDQIVYDSKQYTVSSRTFDFDMQTIIITVYTFGKYSIELEEEE